MARAAGKLAVIPKTLRAEGRGWRTVAGHSVALCRSCAPGDAMPSARWPIRGMIRCGGLLPAGWRGWVQVVAGDPAGQLGAGVQAELGEDV